MEGQSPILEKINAPKCFNKSYPSICIGNLLIKVNKSYFVLKEKMSRHTGGNGVRERSPNVTRGSKKCRRSVTYYLNGPLGFNKSKDCKKSMHIS